MMDERYSVWTYNDDPEWLAGSAGYPDMVIVSQVTLHTAHLAATRLNMIDKGHTYEIRNQAGEIVVTEERLVNPAANPELHIVDIHPRPKRQTRRKLGSREA